jgi:hypothetical protein
VLEARAAREVGADHFYTVVTSTALARVLTALGERGEASTAQAPVSRSSKRSWQSHGARRASTCTIRESVASRRSVTSAQVNRTTV